MKKGAKGFVQLAEAVSLTPADTTVLTVVARHVKKARGDERIDSLIGQLDGDAQQVAEVLRDDKPSGSESIDELAAFLKEWAQPVE